MESDLYILRQMFNKVSTEGLFIIEETRIGYTLEDRVRMLNSLADKIPGQTAIPAGRYEVILSMSNRFKKVLPEILNVPYFSGVRIHGGNTHLDTEGCPLVASNRIAEKDSIYNSISDLVVAKMKLAGGRHFIQIINCWPGGYFGE